MATTPNLIDLRAYILAVMDAMLDLGDLKTTLSDKEAEEIGRFFATGVTAEQAAKAVVLGRKLQAPQPAFVLSLERQNFEKKMQEGGLLKPGMFSIDADGNYINPTLHAAWQYYTTGYIAAVSQTLHRIKEVEADCIANRLVSSVYLLDRVRLRIAAMMKRLDK